MNTENFAAMGEHIAPDHMEALNKAVRATLRGDAPGNKLLGMQFGGQL
ncbi:hypothetical protein [Methylomagnum ishizawai]|nr:hypothetical protein [Methylomagnum ishizawai]